MFWLLFAPGMKPEECAAKKLLEATGRSSKDNSAHVAAVVNRNMPVCGTLHTLSLHAFANLCITQKLMRFKPVPAPSAPGYRVTLEIPWLL